MAIGPCLCGDPYCGRCGDPELARIEAAEEWAMERMSEAKLYPDEYNLAVTVGLKAVEEARKMIKELIADREAEKEEYIQYLEEKLAEREQGGRK